MKAHRTCDWVWRAVKHWGTRDGGNIVCVWTPNHLPNPSHTFPLAVCPWKKKNLRERERHRYTMLWNINSHCCSLPTAGKRAMQVMWAWMHAWVCEHIYECQCISVCTPVWSPFALVFYKCGGGGCALSRHSGCIYYQQMWRCLGMGCLCWASHFYLRSTDVLCKACVGRAGFKKETANWPGYGLLQLNLKH